MERPMGLASCLIAGRIPDINRNPLRKQDPCDLRGKRLESGVFRWPPVTDGVMRLSAAQAGGVVGWPGLDANACAAPWPAEDGTISCMRLPEMPQNSGKALELCLESSAMTSPADLHCDLPDDPSDLRAAALAMRAELEAERALRRGLEDQNERLRHFIRQLQRMQFGRRSEKFDPDQLNLALEDLEQAVAESKAKAEKADLALRRSRGREPRQSRGALPQHLPRIEVVIAPATTVCPCCSEPMHLIGEDRSERLDVIPMRYQVVVTRRPKYGCRGCQSAVVQALAPPRLIEGGLPTERMVAHVLVTKYADHAPLYRQAQMLAWQGIVIDRSTLASWVGYAAAELKPLWRLLRDELLSFRPAAARARG